MTKINKINPMRILDKVKIEYTHLTYVPDENDLSGTHCLSEKALKYEFGRTNVRPNPQKREDKISRTEII